jgi:hypothetical protein
MSSNHPDFSRFQMGHSSARHAARMIFVLSHQMSYDRKLIDSGAGAMP